MHLHDVFHDFQANTHMRRNSRRFLSRHEGVEDMLQENAINAFSGITHRQTAEMFPVYFFPFHFQTNFSSFRRVFERI